MTVLSILPHPTPLTILISCGLLPEKI